MDVPNGLFIKFGCWPKFPYNKYPIILPGNKYKMSNTTNEK